VQDLIDPNDPDWQKFKSGDEDYYLNAAGEEIRNYCGWHLYPSVTETVTKREIGSHGVIILPTRHVTSLTSLVVGNNTVDPAQYTWFEGGWIQLTGAAPGGWAWGWPGAYFYGPDAPYYLPVYNFGLADVTMTHGYDVLPAPIKEVAYELAKGTITVGAGTSNIKEIQSPQYKTVFGQAPGLTLNCDQKGRLADYRIGGFK
jgi:hypothetical protein